MLYTKPTTSSTKLAEFRALRSWPKRIPRMAGSLARDGHCGVHRSARATSMISKTQTRLTEDTTVDQCCQKGDSKCNFVGERRVTKQFTVLDCIWLRFRGARRCLARFRFGGSSRWSRLLSHLCTEMNHVDGSRTSGTRKGCEGDVQFRFSRKYVTQSPPSPAEPSLPPLTNCSL